MIARTRLPLQYHLPELRLLRNRRAPRTVSNSEGPAVNLTDNDRFFAEGGRFVVARVSFGKGNTRSVV